MQVSVQEVVLRFLEGENEGVEIKVSPPRELKMGRSEDCDIFLAEKKISRRHCRLLVNEDRVVLEDLDSTNGTYLNSKKVSGDIEIRSEDRFRVGTSIIEVLIHKEKSVSAAEASVPKKLPKRPKKGSVSLAEASVPEEDIAAKETLEKARQTMTGGEGRGLDLLEDDAPSGVMDVPDEELLSVGIEDSSKKDSSGGPVSDAELEANAHINLSSNLGESFSSFDISVEEPPEVEKSEAKPKSLSGELSAMGLADLLQNLSHNRKSGLLELKSKKKKGNITVEKGKVLTAVLGKAEGVKAVFRMLAWNEGKFALLPLPSDFGPEKIDSKIEGSLETLLMEGFRQFDELEKIRKGLPDESADLKVAEKFNSPLSKLHPRVLDVFQIIMAGANFGEVLDRSPFSDLDTSKIVFYLVKKKYIEAN